MSITSKRKSSISLTSDIGKKSKVSQDKYERSQDIYFDDGNIVLIAEKKAFRVHRGILARHSNVFCDMLDIVDQPQDAEVFDDCPVVQLSDAASDLTALLGALYDVPNLNVEGEDFELVSSVLRLAVKYLMNNMRDYVCGLLAQAYPKTLEQYDTYQGPRDSPMHVVALARQTGIHILLPAALYQVCNHFMACEVMEDPIVSLVDMFAFAMGKEDITAIWPEFLRKEHDCFTEENCDRRVCQEAWRKLMDDKQYSALSSESLLYSDPLGKLKCYCMELDKCVGLCYEDRKAAKLRAKERREEVWDRLPKMFGFDSWDKLKEGY